MLRIRFKNYFALITWRSSRYQSSEVSTIRNVMDEEKLRYQFPDPTKLLHNVIREVCAKLQSPLYKPKVTVNKVSGAQTPQWHAKLTLIWPEHITVEGTAKKKDDAEKLACLLACQKIKELGKLDEGNRPILPETDIAVKGIKIKDAKSALANMFARINSVLESESYKPVYNTASIKDKHGIHGWKSEVTLHWPETFTMKATGMRKSQAEASAAAKAIHWLHQKQVLDKNNYPILYSRNERIQLFHNRWSPYPICIPEKLQNQMKNILENYERMKDDIKKLKSMCSPDENHILQPLADKNSSLSDLDYLEEEDNFLPSLQSSQTMTDIITGRPYQKASEQYLANRSYSMYHRLIQHMESQDPAHLKIKGLQASLPISEKRDQILNLIENNQVVVLSGETGCGKTTQVPQFILDDLIMKMKGAHCNMVVTQPRRISAISISERVAHERGEQLGENFGYQVRLKKELPREKGAVLFCSTGVLLQRLQSNPFLEGISHVIVDEVHERDIQTDFLLVLLKNVIEKNKKLRILLMSASMNAEMFSQYFQNCPIIHVPGIIHPVKEYYLPEVLKLIREYEGEPNNKPLVNYNRILKLIKYIDSNKPPGAILCFLPGWQEIKTVMFELKDLFRNNGHYRIIPVHSRLPAHEQKLMFEATPSHIRKIVLATNVAETSITINDVVYVIDPGCHREMTYDAERGMATLSTNWISRANARQRKGRAGRVQPGECFHLFSKSNFAKMDEFPSPEMHRVPLEKIVLDCKLYCQNTSVQEFLLKAPQPPSQDAISNAIQYLKVLGVLDDNEQLTLLGKHIVHFTTHPSLSKALVYGTFLRCIDPVLTVSAVLTANKDPFTISMENRSEVKEIKKKYDYSTFSDHFALCCLYNDWLIEHFEGRTEERSFCTSNSINYNTMYFVKGLKAVFGNHLYSAGMLENSLYYENSDVKENENCHDSSIIVAALCAALYPNIIKMIRGIMDRGRIKKDEIRCLTLCGQSASIQKESVVAKEKTLPSPWLLYFYGVRSAERRQLLVRDISVIPALSLILLAGQKVDIKMEWNADEALLMIDGEKKLSFSCSKQEAELLLDYRKCLDTLFQSFLQCSGKVDCGEEFSNVEYLKDCAFSVLKELLATPQKQFSPVKDANHKCNLQRTESSSLCI